MLNGIQTEAETSVLILKYQNIIFQFLGQIWVVGQARIKNSTLVCVELESDTYFHVVEI